MQPRDFRLVRWFLTHDASILVANAHVNSQLLYFSGVSKFNLNKLQCIKYTVFTIVSYTKVYASVTPILMNQCMYTYMRLTTSGGRLATAIFFPFFFHLCLVAYMYPTPICDIQWMICKIALGGKNRMTSEFRCMLTKY